MLATIEQFPDHDKEAHTLIDRWLGGPVCGIDAGNGTIRWHYHGGYVQTWPRWRSRLRWCVVPDDRAHCSYGATLSEAIQFHLTRRRELEVIGVSDD